MPSHTFTRVGFWEDSIATNIASAAAARKANSAAETLHALDYQVYAYLQTAQDSAARKVAGELQSIMAEVNKAEQSGGGLLRVGGDSGRVLRSSEGRGAKPPPSHRPRRRFPSSTR